MRRARTVFGGRLTQAPYATWALLAVMAVGFLAQQIQPDLMYTFGMLGLNVLPNGAVAGVATGEWYRLLTSAFLHSGWWHLLFNGVALYVLGPNLERALGHSRYLALWILSALSGSLLSYLVVPHQLSVGASGAIFGLFGAAIIIGRKLGLDTRFLIGLIGVNLVITFVFPNISWTAHLGGLAAGLILAAVYAYLPRPSGTAARASTHTVHRSRIHVGLTVGYALLLLGLAVAGTIFQLN